MHFQKLGLFLYEWAYFLRSKNETAYVQVHNIGKIVKPELSFVWYNTFLTVLENL